MNIAICDDSKADALTAMEVIKQALYELHIKAEFDYYSNASDIEQKLIIKKEPLDILVLDAGSIWIGTCRKVKSRKS